jgi:hypothetical protein
MVQIEQESLFTALEERFVGLPTEPEWARRMA